MVRVWFGDESEGLQRDRQKYVLTLERPCADIDDAKRFYCEGLGFAVVGVTSGKEGRRVFLNHQMMPSFSLCLIRPPDSAAEETSGAGVVLDLGMWSREEWQWCRDKMSELGFSPVTEHTANPYQMYSKYLDPDGFGLRLTFTQTKTKT